jgi:hypothetical protein
VTDPAHNPARQSQLPTSVNPTDTSATVDGCRFTGEVSGSAPRATSGSSYIEAVRSAAELKVGDTIAVFWKPGRDTITALRPYDGQLACMQDARIAEFALNPVGMALEAHLHYEVIA